MAKRQVFLEDIPLDEAWAWLEQALRELNRWDPLAGESVALANSLGRITAEANFALISSPHYHSAAMDGYAVLAEHTYGVSDTRPGILVVGADATPVNTGDPLPAESNAVIMIEDVQSLDDQRIEIRAAVAPWQHVRTMGEDMVQSEMVLPANQRLRPVDLGALAGCGYHEVSVRRRPNVLIIPTGNELVSPNQRPELGQIIEYNSLVLQAQVQEWGGQAQVTGIVPDEPEQLRHALHNAVEATPDLILVLSGSSAGSKDFTASVIAEAGSLLVHGIAVRPGHPVILGIVDNIPVIGVPGYPVSAALTGELFVKPLLQQWLGQPNAPQESVKATMTRKITSPIGDDEYLRVALAQVDDQLLAAPLSRGAGVITSLVRADGLAQIPRFSEGLDAGEVINVRLYRPLEEIVASVLAMGSHDPMLDLLAQYMTDRGHRLVSANVGSMGGLIALRRKQAHLAGIHLLDFDSGDYNLSYVREHLAEIPVRLITFAQREQGLIVAPGNPLDIQSLDDLTRVRYVNRQRGAGTRLLLDYELNKRGIAPEKVSGYGHEEYTHLAVAAAVASDVADCGLGVRSAALAFGLSFVSVAWERYDLCIPEAQLEHPGIAALIGLLSDESFKQALGKQPGYDVSATGIWQL